MTILDSIVAHKRKETAERKQRYPTKILEQNIYFSTPTISLKNSLLVKDTSGIIAEIKRKSPSKGIIHDDVSIERISTGYVQAGATALSILTDKEFFGGTNDDLLTARKFNNCPILRKEFIIDEYQLIEAKSIGADIVLLIAAILTPEEINRFTRMAQSLCMEVILEVHTADEINKNVGCGVDVIGVNNRNLKTFETDINLSKDLSNQIPKGIIKISESGISSPAMINELKKYGYDGFLIGEIFMKHKHPEKAAKIFMDELLTVV
jgi:indole-3-glycerol phosphate synthase